MEAECTKTIIEFPLWLKWLAGAVAGLMTASFTLDVVIKIKKFFNTETDLTNAHTPR